MAERFAASAARLAGIAGAVFGWRPAEFWAATPVELAAVIEAAAPPTPPCAGSDELARLKEMFPDG